MLVSDPFLRREIAENLRRLMAFRELFGEDFVSRQAIVCLQLLGGLGSEF